MSATLSLNKSGDTITIADAAAVDVFTYELHLGAPREDVTAALDAVDAEFERLQLTGMQGWLGIMREVLGV